MDRVEVTGDACELHKIRVGKGAAISLVGKSQGEVLKIEAFGQSLVGELCGAHGVPMYEGIAANGRPENNLRVAGGSVKWAAADL
jgi:hypothetical protein